MNPKIRLLQKQQRTRQIHTKVILFLGPSDYRLGHKNENQTTVSTKERTFNMHLFSTPALTITFAVFFCIAGGQRALAADSFVTKNVVDPEGKPLFSISRVEDKEGKVEEEVVEEVRLEVVHGFIPKDAQGAMVVTTFAELSKAFGGSLEVDGDVDWAAVHKFSKDHNISVLSFKIKPGDLSREEDNHAPPPDERGNVRRLPTSNKVRSKCTGTAEWSPSLPGYWNRLLLTDASGAEIYDHDGIVSPHEQTHSQADGATYDLYGECYYHLQSEAGRLIFDLTVDGTFIETEAFNVDHQWFIGIPGGAWQVSATVHVTSSSINHYNPFP